MLRASIVALLVILTGLKCSEPRAAPQGCPSEVQCTKICGEDEECLDACLSDDDECVGLLET